MWVPINSQNRSGSCSENCGFLYCSSREMLFREWKFSFRESVSEFRELLRECPGILRELREWPFHFESVFSGTSFRRGDFAPREPNSTPNSGMRIFEPRILGPNSGVEFFGPMFSNKKSPLKNSPPRNSPPKIHIKKFTPEFGLKNSHRISAGPFC